MWCKSCISTESETGTHTWVTRQCGSPQCILGQMLTHTLTVLQCTSKRGAEKCKTALRGLRVCVFMVSMCDHMIKPRQSTVCVFGDHSLYHHGNLFLSYLHLGVWAAESCVIFTPENAPVRDFWSLEWHPHSIHTCFPWPRAWRKRCVIAKQIRNAY